MKTHNMHISTHILNIQLKLHVLMSNIHQAFNILMDACTESNLSAALPDHTSISTILAPTLSNHDFDFAEKMMTEMINLESERTPHLLQHVSALIAALARASQPERADGWLILAETKLDMRLDTITYNAVLAAFAAVGDAESARQVMRRLNSRQTHFGEASGLSYADRVSFNTLISACARAGEPVEAELAFREMLNLGLKPDQLSYSSVISAHARAGNASHAQAWLTRMVDSGIQPDAVTFNTMCSAHARVGDANSALACFRAMNEAGISASSTTHAIMVHALVQAGDIDTADMTLRSLINRGERLSASSFNPLISAYAKANRTDEAEKVLSLMVLSRVEPTLVTFNSIAAAHATAGDLDSVEKILAEATRRLGEGALDRYSYGALLQACIKANGQVSEKNCVHVKRIIASGIHLNKYLLHMSSIAVGDELCRHLLEEQTSDRRDMARMKAAAKARSANSKVSAGKIRPRSNTYPQYVRPAHLANMMDNTQLSQMNPDLGVFGFQPQQLVQTAMPVSGGFVPMNIWPMMMVPSFDQNWNAAASHQSFQQQQQRRFEPRGQDQRQATEVASDPARTPYKDSQSATSHLRWDAPEFKIEVPNVPAVSTEQAVPATQGKVESSSLRPAQHSNIQDSSLPSSNSSSLNASPRILRRVGLHSPRSPIIKPASPRNSSPILARNSSPNCVRNSSPNFARRAAALSASVQGHQTMSPKNTLQHIRMLGEHGVGERPNSLNSDVRNLALDVEVSLS